MNGFVTIEFIFVINTTFLCMYIKKRFVLRKVLKHSVEYQFQEIQGASKSPT